MNIDYLIEQIFLYPRPFVLTGAGISTESGIPDFRGSGGLWEKVDPMETFSAWAFKDHPERLYQHAREVFGFILKAQPNAGHKVLGEWQRKRIIGPIVTQNIDNLHQKGGAFFVYEVHGHVRTATCSRCHKTTKNMESIIRDLEKGIKVPLCSCGGVLKPDVILFGDAMPYDYMYSVKMADIYSALPQMIIVVGSSLAVSPINSLPLSFDKFSIINNSPTMLDRQADIIINGLTGEVLSEMHRKILSLNGGQELKPLPAGFIPGRLFNIVAEFYRNSLKTAKTGEYQKIVKFDISLLENLFSFYIKEGRQQELEYYLVETYLSEIEKIKQELGKNFRFLKPDNSYLLKYLYKLLESLNKAVFAYARQHNASEKVLEELVMQFLGTAGLYEYLKNLAKDKRKDGVSSMVDAVEKFAYARGLAINRELALKDF
ncbi:Sir2 family NAD-dependent protein deacetylase [Thermosyntropha sp.]|uniref:SIR2 family NAD-dependent protein deacylase n=1 Tax=Thermosyntropha sp. TaxID=2740820 RepID=UPI0025D08D02|nr:Sir2 family NAD-dependent protein deacetylase [Thermosyntropha sp.]MBO8159822.1 hypothetical protein [Thermosyntropha sp.]